LSPSFLTSITFFQSIQRQGNTPAEKTCQEEITISFYHINCLHQTSRRTDNLHGFARIIGATFEQALRTSLPDKMARPRQALFSPDLLVLIGHFAMMRQNIGQFAVLSGSQVRSGFTGRSAICYWQKFASNQALTRHW